VKSRLQPPVKAPALPAFPPTTARSSSATVSPAASPFTRLPIPPNNRCSFARPFPDAPARPTSPSPPTLSPSYPPAQRPSSPAPAAIRLWTSGSPISTWTNDVTGTYIIGANPSRAIISRDDSSLWVTNFGADSTSLYSINDGRLITSVRDGSHPDALAFCICNGKDEHLLLVVDSGSGDVAVIRNQSNASPSLFTMLPAGSHPKDIVVKAFNAK